MTTLDTHTTPGPAPSHVPGPTPSPGSTPSPSLWGRVRRLVFRPLTLVLVSTLLLVGGVIALALSMGARVEDDPRSVGQNGSAALVQLLRDEGVDIEVTSSLTDITGRPTTNRTVVVTAPDLMRAEQWRLLLASQPADLVVLRPGNGALYLLSAPVTTRSFDAESAETPASCPDPDAVRAGSLQLDRTRLILRAGTGVGTGSRPQGCFPLGDGHASVTYQQGPTRIHLLAGGNRNSELAQAGNASFTMATMGRHEQLLWLVATPSTDRTPEPRGPLLLPQGWGWAWLTAVPAFVVVCIWRGRRLGPILSERLPVRVHASETVEGHGRLYHRMRARDRAAEALREATVRRLGRRFGQSDPLLLATLIADSTGRPLDQIRRALAGPVPANDDELVALKKTLDRIEQEVRTL